MLNINPKYGSFSETRKSYNKINKKKSICLNYLKYINLDKFGNDDKNFAAILINGHNDNRICEQLEKKLTSAFQSFNFTKLTNSNDIGNFIDFTISQFENDFCSKMSALSKKMETMYQDILKSHKEDMKKLKKVDDIEKQLNSGVTVAIVIMVKNKMYIFNIGDNQIILTSKDDDYNDEYNQKFILLSDVQNFHNEKEIQRIKEDCGLDPDSLRWLLSLSIERRHSRCIGDFEIKYNFNKFQSLSKAKRSPLISTSQPSKLISLEENFTYIILISSGFYYLVRELIYDMDKIPGEITRKIFEIKVLHPELSLDQLCKIVVESFVIEHKRCHDQYINLTGDNCTSWEYSYHDDLSIFIIELNVSHSIEHVEVDVVDGFSLLKLSSTNASFPHDFTDGKDFSNSMKDQFSSLKSSTNSCHNTVPAYVDFQDWTEAFKKLSEDELAFIDSILDSSKTSEKVISEENEVQVISRSTTVEDQGDVVSTPTTQLRLWNGID